MSERRRSHFFLFPFFFFLLFFDFLRPPGITGLIAGGLVGDGFGAEASVVVAAADGASAAGAGASAVVVASALVSEGFGGAGASAVAAAGAGTFGAASACGKAGEETKLKSAIAAASVRLGLTIDLSAPRGLALTRSLAALSAKK